MVFGRHLPDVEGLGGGVGQEAEHQDDGVGVGEAIGVDLPVQRDERLMPIMDVNRVKPTQQLD